MQSPVSATRSIVFETALGHVGLAWSDDAIVRLVLPEADQDVAAARLARDLRFRPGSTPAPDFVDRARAAILRYCGGEAIDFDELPVDLPQLDPFDRAVCEAARGLRFGETITYGALAALAGRPDGARETGAALGRNPVPLIVPCHRVVAAGGRIGGFSAPGGPRTKARLLAHEGALPQPPSPAQVAFDF